jgi:hypothetical protein
LKTKTKREKSTTTTGHYVRNADLLPAVIEAKAKGEVTERLIKMVWMIADRYSKKGSFVNYSFRADMVSSAVENLCKNALKFNCEKYDNPFAFYTTAIHNSFLQFIANEKKQQNIRDKLLINAGSNPSFNYVDSTVLKELDGDLVNPNDIGECEETARYPGREPGEVTILTGADLVYDAETRSFVRKAAE